MRKYAVLGLAVLALSACSHNKGSGDSALKHNRPDEFAVSRQVPLVIPPDYALAPPAPGKPRPQDADSSQQTLRALFGGTQARSAAETSTLQSSGANNADPAIRSTAASESTTVVDKGAQTREIINSGTGALGTPQTSAGH